MDRGLLLYSIRRIPGTHVSDRAARKLQSKTAADLLAGLHREGGLSGPSSKSHSRALVAAAASSSSVQALGIDIEWMSPDRPFDEILRTFAPSAAGGIGCTAFYKTWTFLEAYYKAFQRWPSEEMVRQVMAIPEADTPQSVAPDVLWLQFRAAAEFQLSIVWKGSDLCTVRCVPGSQA